MKLTSSAFEDNGEMPKDYGCSGAGKTPPPLSIADVPEAAKSLALIVDDPDAPDGHFTHWVVWNIPPASKTLQGVEGQNSYGRSGWGAPCPPSGIHHYVFDLYALDTAVEIPPDKGKDELEKAMAGLVIAQAELTGRYKR